MHFPFGSESHDYLGYFIVQCVPDIQLSEIRQAFSQLANALQSGNLSAAVGVIQPRGLGLLRRRLRKSVKICNRKISTVRNRPSPRCSSNSRRVAIIVTTTVAYHRARTARMPMTPTAMPTPSVSVFRSRRPLIQPTRWT
jgi:hypothetical protein